VKVRLHRNIGRQFEEGHDVFQAVTLLNDLNEKFISTKRRRNGGGSPIKASVDLDSVHIEEELNLKSARKSAALSINK
jgi:hypothetical protein